MPTRTRLPAARYQLPPAILTIAGSDSGAGAGIQADLKTATALGCHACTAITAVTAQDARGVSASHPVPPRLVTAQIKSALTGFRIRAIKTGLLPNAATVRVVAGNASDPAFAAIPLIIDPVLASTSGTRFLDAAGVRALKKDLLPRATLITPNWPEAAELTGTKIRTLSEAQSAARQLATEYRCAILLKGGHAAGKTCSDILVVPVSSTAGHRLRSTVYQSPRIATPNTHGTGCVLSAAIACALAQGQSLDSAIRTARQFLTRSLLRRRHQEWPGRGPVL